MKTLGSRALFEAPHARPQALGVAATLGLVALALAGCASDADGACQTGAESSVAAVETLIEAAASADLARACTVTSRASDEVLESTVDDVAQLVEEAGGVEVLRVSERTDLQMGSSFVVEVAGAATKPTVQFVVTQSGGRYLVGISDVGIGTSEAANPTPRPTTSSR